MGNRKNDNTVEIGLEIEGEYYGTGKSGKIFL